MDSTIFGYVRISSKEQNEDRQMIALSNFKILEKNIYMDKLSGKDFNRPAYRRMVKKLKEGDTLIVKSIDRLGRNYEEILEQWRLLTKDKGVRIVVLDMPLLDTTRDNDLTGTLIADIVLQLLSYVAQTERENIRQRQREGIDAAKQRGVRFGRPAKQVPVEFFSVQERWLNGKITSRQAALELGVAQDTFLRWTRLELKSFEESKQLLEYCQ